MGVILLRLLRGVLFEEGVRWFLESWVGMGGVRTEKRSNMC